MDFGHAQVIVSLSTLLLGIVLTSCSTLEQTDAQVPARGNTESPPTSAAPQSQLQKPAEVLADVMKNYLETTTDCREYGTNRPRGHYYCSGVLARTVNDGNFNPWIYGPTAFAIGASSYSWSRQDVTQTQLYHPAGFILRNRIDAAAHGLPGLKADSYVSIPLMRPPLPSMVTKGAVIEQDGWKTLRRLR